MEAVLDKFFGVHAKALQLWSERTELLGSNIANADTPHYKAQDIDFKDVLGSMTGAGSQDMHMKITSDKHIGPQLIAETPAEIKYRVPLQASLDGNTVESQIEHSLFAENAIRHQISLQFLSNRISGLVRTLREE